MKYKININTKQYDNNNGGVDEMNTSSIGELFDKKGELYVVYKEVEGEESVTNTLKIGEDKVTMIKYGQKSSTMIFKEEYNHTTRYQTPYGIFMIDTKTSKLLIDKKENHIKIYIEYNINIQDLFEGRNEIEISLDKM